MLVFSTFLIGLMVILQIIRLAGAQGERQPYYYKAKIHYCDWMMVTNLKWNPDAVRNNASALIVVEGSRMPALLKLLDLSDVKKKSQQPGDARVVFDLEEIDGKVVTYYADMSHIFNSDSSQSRSVGLGFRKQLSDFIKSMF